MQLLMKPVKLDAPYRWSCLVSIGCQSLGELGLVLHPCFSRGAEAPLCSWDKIKLDTEEQEEM